MSEHNGNTDIVNFEEKRLLNIEAAAVLLAEATTIPEITKIRDYAETVRLVARQAKMGLEAQNRAAELKLRAERKAGEMLATMDRVKPGDVTPSSTASSIGKPKLSDIGVTGDQSSNWQRIAAIPTPDFERHIETTKASDEELTTAATVRLAKSIQQGEKMQVHYSSDTPEWYTPEHILERVYQVMGGVDLDPCSNSKDQPTVDALTHFTIEDDGLQLDWVGRVYMNPPYGNEIKDWVEKLASEYENGNVLEAIALVPSRTDTAWFQRLKEYPRCFVWGRLKFSGANNSAPFPSMLVYLGNNWKAFVEAFSDIGDVYALVQLQ